MINSKQMQEAENRAVEQGISVADLMENAGKQVYLLSKQKYELHNHQVIIFAGTGNNAGDGFVTARYFAKELPVIVLLFGDKDKIKDEAKENYKKIKDFIPIIEIKNGERLKDFHLQQHLKFFYLDALLGTGIKGKIKDPISQGIDFFNSGKAIKVAIDLPSGLDPDTGKIKEKMCNVDYIICLHDLKVGLNNFKDKCVIANIGIPEVKDND